MKKIRLMQIALCYPPSTAGGPAMSLKGINDSLSTNIEVNVFTTKFGMESDVCQSRIPIEVKYIGANSLSLLLEAIRRINNYNIIQFSSVFYFPNIFLFWIAFCLRKKIFLSPRGELFQPAINSSKRKLKKLLIFLLKPLSARIVFIATSNQEKRQIIKHFTKAKVVVIPNSANFPEYKKPKRVRDEILFVGRLSPIKNIELILLALNYLKDEKIILNILGDSWTRDEILYKSFLEKMISELGIEDNVVFKGHIDGQDKYTAIARCSCLILPSLSENFGNVVLESLYTGTPVITSNTTPWNYLSSIGLGHSIDYDSVIDLAESIKYYQKMSDDKFKKLSTDCHIHWRENYHLSVVGEKWRSLFSLCVE